MFAQRAGDLHGQAPLGLARSRSVAVSPTQRIGSSPAASAARHLVGQRLVVLAEVLAALGVPEQHAGRAASTSIAMRHLAGEGADRRGVRVLAEDADAERRQHVGDLRQAA